MENPFPDFCRATWDLLKGLSWLLISIAIISALVIAFISDVNQGIIKYDNVDTCVVVQVRYSDAHSKIEAMNEAKEFCEKNGFELDAVEDSHYGKNTFIKVVGFKKMEDMK